MPIASSPTRFDHASPPSTFRPEVEVRRSERRRRTVSAYRDGARIVVLIPSRFSAADEARWVSEMVQRLDAGARRRRGNGDVALARRAAELSASYLGGRAQPATVRWVAGMRTRWASCTPADGTIRLSERLRDMPHWVRDYVLVHELAHLLVAGHGPDFWALVQRYPRTERARGYLDGVSATASLGFQDDLAGDLTDIVDEADESNTDSGGAYDSGTDGESDGGTDSDGAYDSQERYGPDAPYDGERDAVGASSRESRSA